MPMPEDGKVSQPQELPPTARVLRLDTETDPARAEQVLRALGSEPRLRILKLLSDRVCNVSEIAKALDLPLSTITLHLNALAEAGLVRAELQSARHGLQKVCARMYDTVTIELPPGGAPAQHMVAVSMPVGAYLDFQVTPTCGLASESNIIGLVDDPGAFYEPEHTQAQILWFRQGYVEYRFPNRLPPKAVPESLSLSLEICSEAPLHRDDWPSDITFSINGVQVGTWTSPGDFGGQRGLLTPAWWESWSSQYGLLKTWLVNGRASFIDGVQVSSVRLQDLGITDRPFISVRFEVKADAKHVGGINIFGQRFGNYPQDIVLRLRYR